MVNFSDSDPSLGTIDVMKYVSQCEKRLSEQEQLISLLREKLLAYESTSTSSPSGGVAERPNTYAKAASDEATIGDSPTSEDNSTSVKKPRAPPKKTTKEKSTKPTVPARGGGAAVAKTPEVPS
ncbi:hypothetical protein M8J75_015629 [Diaphorina citri]|nr:hypothetical protein M8J75_015629 [Diaphorina citri]